MRIYRHSIPNTKILDATKLDAFAEDTLNAAEMLVSVFDRGKNIVRKGENAGYQHFLIVSQCFQIPPLSDV